MSDDNNTRLRIITNDGAEVRTISGSGGQKGRKPARASTLHPEALRALALVGNYGEQKYDLHNYLKGYDWDLNYDAAMRHLWKFWEGETIDPESGQPHVVHAAWHCLVLHLFTTFERGTDTRPPDMGTPPEEAA